MVPNADPSWSPYKQWSIITSFEAYNRVRFGFGLYAIVSASEERLVVAYQAKYKHGPEIDEPGAARGLANQLLDMGRRKGCVMPRVVVVRMVSHRPKRGSHESPVEPDVPEPGEHWFNSVEGA
jgi:hypothetical protein